MFRDGRVAFFRFLPHLPFRLMGEEGKHDLLDRLNRDIQFRIQLFVHEEFTGGFFEVHLTPQLAKDKSEGIPVAFCTDPPQGGFCATPQTARQ
jgi:hypothetical protein